LLKNLPKILKRGGYGTDLRHRFGFFPRLPKTAKKRLWIQAVSVGEVKAIEQLVARLGEHYEIVLTTTTSTARKTIVQKLAKSVLFCGYFPWDFWPFSWLAWRYSWKASYGRSIFGGRSGIKVPFVWSMHAYRIVPFGAPENLLDWPIGFSKKLILLSLPPNKIAEELPHFVPKPSNICFPEIFIILFLQKNGHKRFKIIKISDFIFDKLKIITRIAEVRCR
jgi:hypothetical protein